MTVTILVLLSGVYVLFFAAQAATLFSAFTGVRPEGLTYAEYARQGFLSFVRWQPSTCLFWEVYAYSRKGWKGGLCVL